MCRASSIRRWGSVHALWCDGQMGQLQGVLWKLCRVAALLEAALQAQVRRTRCGDPWLLLYLPPLCGHGTVGMPRRRRHHPRCPPARATAWAPVTISTSLSAYFLLFTINMSPNSTLIKLVS